MCKRYITQIKELRLRIEGCESRMVSRLRQPVDKEPLKACAQRTTEHKVCWDAFQYKPVVRENRPDVDVGKKRPVFVKLWLSKFFLDSSF